MNNNIVDDAFNARQEYLAKQELVALRQVAQKLMSYEAGNHAILREAMSMAKCAINLHNTQIDNEARSKSD